MRSDATQPTLLSRVRDPADHEAWLEFDGKYRELIVRYAAARGLQHSDAEDLCQAVMGGLAKSMRSFQYRPEIGRFRDYLGVIARNAVSKHFSCPTAPVVSLCPDDFEVRGDLEARGVDRPEDEKWESEWMHHHFRRALDSVRRDVEERSIEIFMDLLNGSSVPDLARDYAMTDQAIYKVKTRIRDRLHERIAEQVRDEEFPERHG